MADSTSTVAQCREQWSTRIAFFVAGLGMSAWAPLVPAARSRTGLSDGQLGLMLLCLGIGSIIAMPVAGMYSARLGCRRVILVSTWMMAGALPLLGLAQPAWLLAVALLLFGAGVGALDVSANIQAVAVEQASGRSLMSGFHGLFSLGGIVGAAGVSGLLATGVPTGLAAAVVSAICVLGLLKARPGLLAAPSEHDGAPGFALPRGSVLWIGMFSFVLFLAEGSILDWSALLLSRLDGINTGLAGLAYAAFAATMTAGRLTGDRVVARLGAVRVVRLGSLMAALGLLMATMAASWPLALAGFALVGAGCSNVVPVLFSSVGRQADMPAGNAIPAITTLGYAGILCGPAAIGLIAGFSGLPAALLVVAALLGLVSALAMRVPHA